MKKDTLSLTEHKEIYFLARKNFLISLFLALLIVLYFLLKLMTRDVHSHTDFFVLCILSFGAIVFTFVHLGTLRFLRSSAKKSLEELVYLDKLTQVYNYHYVEKKLGRELEKARRFSSSISLIYIDVDNFKQVNDTYGHQTGDRVLKRVASLISSSVRGRDSVSRMGGDEFLVIMPDTVVEGATATAGRIKKKMDGFSYKLDSKPPIDFLRLSMGIVKVFQDCIIMD